ncbi:hypothetical protein ACFX2C_004544 [Malus domestica]
MNANCRLFPSFVRISFASVISPFAEKNSRSRSSFTCLGKFLTQILDLKIEKPCGALETRRSEIFPGTKQKVCESKLELTSAIRSLNCRADDEILQSNFGKERRCRFDVWFWKSSGVERAGFKGLELRWRCVFGRVTEIK